MKTSSILKAVHFSSIARGLFVGVMTLAFSVSAAQASAELDRQFRLQKIGILKPWDNVDGLFSSLVAEGATEELLKESRFQVSDLRKTSDVLSQSKIPYLQLIEEKDVLIEIAKKQGLDALIRSKVMKEGPIYRFQLDLIFGRTAQILATDQFQVKDPFLAENSGAGETLTSGKSGNLNSVSGSESFQRALRQSVGRLVGQIPFRGMLTGRDAGMVTLDVGARSNLRKGDRLVIGTLEELKEHPLLKKIVDWRFTTTGKVVITEVDDGMAFGRIEAEEVGRQLARYQKVLQIISAPEEDPAVESRKLDLEDREKALRLPPRLGYFSPGIFLGSYSREATSGSGGTGYTGSAFSFGFQGDAQLWLTSRWFAELGFGFSTGSYSQKNSVTQVKSASSGSARMSQYKLALGYFFPFSDEFFGPRAFVRAGFQGTTFSLPNSATDLTSPTKVTGLTFGLGGDLPIRGDYGAALSLDFGPFSGGSESGSYYGTTSGATTADFRLSGYSWLQPKMKLQMNLDFRNASLDFTNGASLSNKMLTIGPSLLFYF
jgi:hypothetical protein